MSDTHLPRRRHLSDYESDALDAIMAWRHPESNWFQRASYRMQSGLSLLSNQVRKIPGVDWTIDNVIAGLITATNEFAQNLVWRETIFETYRKAGHETVHELRDIPFLDLEAVDGVIKDLPLKYDSLAAVSGVTAGAAGAVGILPDIVSLLALNLRAAGEYATFCGYDILDTSERLYALHILDAATRPREQIPFSVPLHLHHAPRTVARKKTLTTVEQFAVGGTAKRLIKSIALRITRNKLAQALPVAGAVVAGGFNSLYTHTVCDTAYHLYRERFLEDKYGL